MFTKFQFYQFDRVLDLPVVCLIMELLREVDQGGEGQDGHRHQDEQEAEFLVGLLQCVEQRL